jgi:hypothetical protein
MRRLDLAILVATMAGCNAWFGVTTTDIIDAPTMVTVDAEIVPPDRDRDGIIDVDDPCIASIADAYGDYEGDAYLNNVDGCPFDYENLDSEGDTIYDDCDPFPALSGDRRRCIMMFQNPTITRALFVPRSGDTATWSFLGLSGIVGQGTGTLVAAEKIEAPASLTTTYDTLFYLDQPRPPATQTAVTLWVRTNQTPAASDVGCELRGDGSATTLSLLGASIPTSVVVNVSIKGGWRLQATFAPTVTGRSNVRCTLRSAFTVMSSVKVGAEIVLPPGTAGVGLDAAQAQLGGIWILERDDAPTL